MCATDEPEEVAAHAEKHNEAIHVVHYAFSDEDSDQVYDDQVRRVVEAVHLFECDGLAMFCRCCCDLCVEQVEVQSIVSWVAIGFVDLRADERGLPQHVADKLLDLLVEVMHKKPRDDVLCFVGRQGHMGAV